MRRAVFNAGPFAFRLCGCALLVLLLGCPWSNTHYVPDPDREKGLPEDPKRLLALADQLTGATLAEAAPPVAKSDRAIAALEKARRLGAPHFDVLWRLARACFCMTEALSVKGQIRNYAARGIEYARKARSLNKERVEPHYFLALNTAKVAEVTADVELIKAMVIPAKEAARLDNSYDEAGPLRFLGKVYLTAPAWPVSVGNPEKAIDTLEQAVKVSPIPLNRIFLGQAYFNDEEYPAAERQLKTALNDGRSKRLDPRWEKEARDYLNRIAAGATSDPRTSF